MSRYTPMMQQFLGIKEKHPNSILFFRLGDFYEMFFEDAQKAAQILDLTLTSREAGKGNRVPMAGIPFHAAEGYIATLIENGQTVAICEQVEDPKEAKGVVKREVTRIITPGTVMDPGLLDEKHNNYLCIVLEEENVFGIASVDLSTGEFYTTQIDSDNSLSALKNELHRLRPAELLLGDAIFEKEKWSQFAEEWGGNRIASIKEHEMPYQRARNNLLSHFEETTLEKFGCEEKPMAVRAAAAAFNYLKETQKGAFAHITELKTYEVSSFMTLDAATRRNLELTQTIKDGKTKGSLLWVLDKTVTAMGGRLLRQWTEQPLIQEDRINERLDAVEEITNHHFLRHDLKEQLKEIYDLDRLTARTACDRANARDLKALAQSLAMTPVIQELLAAGESFLLKQLYDRLHPLDDLVDMLASGIAEDPPLTLKDGGLIKEGFCREIDEYRRAAKEGKHWLGSYEAEEKKKTGIKTLKIGYNRVFGYYFTVTKSYAHLVPDHYRRKQTLTNAERYTTDKLMEYESKILGAEEKLASLEYEAFCNLRDKVNQCASAILENSRHLAALDAIISLAEVAARNQYCKPVVNNSLEIHVTSGRHPVVENTMNPGEFVPNDVACGMEDQTLLIITGPNMAGKSTYMRQIALIVLMSQIGSFVPADQAIIGVVDRIFTRVGAQDDLASGQSTFMVEMNEVAQILEHATPKSLLILDEVGRGTSTFDGLSIAWSVAEYIHNHPSLQCKTLFATHYHELTELEELLPRVCNYSVAVKEKGEQVIFLHKIKHGGADRSYGIQVARLAGLPKPVLQRAKEILFSLEKREEASKNIRKTNDGPAANDSEQLAFFANKNHPVLKKLENINVENTTPLEALHILNELKNMSQEGESDE